MKYLSICSGIEAATVAWKPMGWEPIAFSEIEDYPSSLLEFYYPEVPNLGDVHQLDSWQLDHFDLQVGGTPCQSFSVSGLRGGLQDARGNLALVYCLILKKFRPRWFIWENVPGVLTSSGGRDFKCLLSAMAELGYGFCYRVLDARFFGVPQNRRRVFVVGYLGDWRPPAAVLLESESVSWHFDESGTRWQDRFPTRAPSVVADGGRLARLNRFCSYKDDGRASTIAARDYKSPRDLVYYGDRVRKLTVREMERLMGFPDDYTKIAYGGFSADNCPDKQRIKALGNSMVVPVMAWLGDRINRFRFT
jgi:DNA (cytosine-5)-methyltransferase 1